MTEARFIVEHRMYNTLPLKKGLWYVVDTLSLVEDSKWYPAKHKAQALADALNTIHELKGRLDSIKVRSYELGQKEIHDMALNALKAICE